LYNADIGSGPISVVGSLIPYAVPRSQLGTYPTLVIASKQRGKHVVFNNPKFVCKTFFFGLKNLSVDGQTYDYLTQTTLFVANFHHLVIFFQSEKKVLNFFTVTKI
jgi:hypothetical protein